MAIITLSLIALAGAAIVATVHNLRIDGYRRIPTSLVRQGEQSRCQ